MGPSVNLSIGNVEKGEEAQATITGTTPNLELNLTLPKGDQGIQGVQGPRGPQGSKGDKGDKGDTGDMQFTTFDVVDGKLIAYYSTVERDYNFQLNGNKLEVVLDE